MKLFSAQGLNKLEACRDQLSAIIKTSKDIHTQQQTIPPDFTLSQNIIIGFKILNILIDENNSEFVKQNKIEIQQFARSLDDNTGSDIPTVYNETTLQFALMIQQCINSIDIETDLIVSPQFLYQLISFSKDRINLKVAKMHLDINIKLYQCTTEAWQRKKTYHDVSNHLTQIKTAQKALTEYLKQESNDPQKIKIAISNYNKNCAKWYQEYKQLIPRHITLGGLNLNHPAALSVTKHEAGLYTTTLENKRGAIIWADRLSRRQLQQCLEAEALIFEHIQSLNASNRGNQLKLNGLYSQLRDDYTTFCDHSSLNQNIAHFIMQTTAAIDSYMTGKHLPFFKRIDTIKAILLKIIKTELTKATEMADSDPGCVIAELISICLECYLIHNFRVKEKTIRHGKAGSILSASLLKLLQLLTDVSQTNDSYLINRYADAFNQDKIESKLIKSHILDNHQQQSLSV